MPVAELETWQCQEPAIAGLQKKERNLYHPFKRLLDLMLVFTLLVLLLPLMLLIAVLIKLDSPGPVIFVQPRVGAKRRTEEGKDVWYVQTFPLYKFRSMHPSADPSVHIAAVREFVRGRELCLGVRSNFKLGNDTRVTRAGRILRRTSLDELPQLLNVIKGDMSLVGPRPVPTYEVALYKEPHFERLAALPGITGMWQTKGRGDVTFEQMVQMDIQYVRNLSLSLDLKCLILTIPAVLSGRGAE